MNDFWLTAGTQELRAERDRLAAEVEWRENERREALIDAERLREENKKLRDLLRDAAGNMDTGYSDTTRLYREISAALNQTQGPDHA